MSLAQSPEDPARPYFRRPVGKIGVYIDVMEAGAHQGSEHYYVMLITEVLARELNDLSKVELRGAFEERQALDGCTLEEFKDGIIMVLSVGSVEHLDKLWASYKLGKLTAAAQSALLPPDVLGKLRTSTIAIRCKLWDDEYKACRDELDKRCVFLEPSERDADAQLARQVRERQELESAGLMELKDLAEAFEASLGEFVHIVKKHLNNAVKSAATSTIESFAAFVQQVRRQSAKEGDFLSKYLELVRRLRDTYHTHTKVIWHTLCQMHYINETPFQRQAKEKMAAHCREAAAILAEGYQLGRLTCPEWESRMLPAERMLMSGVVYVVPLALKNVVGVDFLVDEYFSSGYR